jgi:hypothetical protein
MTVHRQQAIQTVTDTSNIKYNISEVIDLLSPFDTPLLTLLGYSSLKFPCDQVKHEWLEDELKPRAGTLDAAYVAGSGTLTVQTDEGNWLAVDDLILVGDNVLQILAGPPDSDTFVVVGGVGGSTDAAAADDAVVTRLASALPEASVSRMDATKVVLTLPYNYTQIFRDQCIVSGTMNVISRYGYVSERAYQEEKVLRQLAIDMEHVLLYGVRSHDSGPPRRSTVGGLFEYILLAGVSGSWSTVIDAASATFTETMLNNLLQQIWEEGGSVDTLLVNGYNQRVITSWATPRIRTERDERMAGAHIANYESDFGSISIILDRWLRASDVVALTRSDIGIGPLNGRAFSSREVPSLGDYIQTEVLGEYTMEVHRPSMAHGWYYGTATS